MEKTMTVIPESVQKVLAALEASGYEGWCVGGCVRDLLLGRNPGDWDVTTNALPEETMSVFAGHAIPTGLQHGTVTVRQDHCSVEVTTYRVDGVYLDHRRPNSVTFTRSLEEDLQRRDFTVNAMALGLRGELRDPFGGREDLKNRTLRCVGDPDCRLNEDALRILRGLRFSAVLGFEIEEKSSESIHRNRELLREIAAERIQTEFLKLLSGPFAVNVLRAYPDVIGVFWPEILPMVGFDQKNHHHCYDVWEHTLHALEATPEDAVLRCAVLLHDIGKPQCFTVDEAGVGHFYGHGNLSRELADQMLRRLKWSTDFRETVIRLVDWHDRMVEPTEKGVRKALRRLGEQDLRRLIAVKRADNFGQAPEFRSRQQELDLGESILERLLEEDACFSLKQLEISGHDLLRLGLKGPAIGNTLEALLDSVVNGDLPNERQILLETAKKRREG